MIHSNNYGTMYESVAFHSKWKFYLFCGGRGLSINTQNRRGTQAKFLLQVPELGEGASRGRLSSVIPGGSLCSILNDNDKDVWGDPLSWKQDEEDPLPLTWSSSRPFALSGSSKAEGCESKWDESKIISGCWLKKLRRISHWISFSKCLLRSPCGHCKICSLQNHKIQYSDMTN